MNSSGKSLRPILYRSEAGYMKSLAVIDRLACHKLMLAGIHCRPCSSCMTSRVDMKACSCA